MTSRQDFVRQLANVEFTRATPELTPHLLALFDDATIDWQDLARPVASILLHENADEALLHAYLRQCINTSYALERRFITMCRDALRDRAHSAPLIASLAIQAFHNGYVWPMRDEEFAALRSVSEGESVRRVLVDEPAEEQRLAATLIDEVPDDPITAAVRAQYEEHPYPRWLSLHRPAIVDLKERRILVAGCGTGRDAITLALRHPAATIEAIDISRRSLGYAMRKAREVGANNIRFRLADLRQIDGSYDAIHANGVIHHLADPAEGLRALRTMLNGGGEIVAAIYSRRGRASLARLRALGGDGTDLRAARERIFAALDERERAELEDLDFFDLAHFRDTLYHAHQLELTPLQLDDIIRAAGLVSVDDDLAALDAAEAANPDLFRNMFRVRLRVA